MSEFLTDIVADARRSLHLRKVVLFGSRARGTARPDSDYDLAFVHDSSAGEWSEFCNRMEEEALTLLPLDLVDWREASAALKDSITREGQVLYER